MNPVIVLSLITAILLTGCVNLKPQTDQTKLYTLGLNSTVPTSGSQSAPVLYIARPDFPSYLRGSSMRYHTHSGEISALKGARWGEELGEGIARALGEYVQATGKASVSSQFPWPKLSREDLELRVLFKRFAATDTGQIQVQAVWQIRDGQRVVKEGTYESSPLQWEVDSPSSYVAQLNGALAELANRIVAQL
jgi:uncharacterized lipoprotein YmbA